MIELTLTDLIDVSTLQEIQDGYDNLTGMAALTTDAAGTAVTKGSNFTDFCMNYTRKSKVGCARCEQCDKSGGEETMRTGRATAYFCHGGLVEFAAPDFVFIVAKALSNIAYQTYTANRTNTLLADMNDSIMNKVDEAQKTVKTLSKEYTLFPQLLMM